MRNVLSKINDSCKKVNFPFLKLMNIDSSFREYNYYSFYDAHRKLVYTNHPQKGGQVIKKPSRREAFWFSQVS